MKLIRPLLLSTLLLASFTGIVAARAVRIWPNQELLDKSDLVVLATPTANIDTTERTGIPGFEAQPVVGVETKFSVSAVLKGDQTLRAFVFHHYRTPDGTNAVQVPNGPTVVSFELSSTPTAFPRTYLLFLHRETDGRYASTVGQVDPGGGVKELK